MKTKNFLLPLTLSTVVLLTSCAKPLIFESKKAESNILANSTNKIATNSDKKKDIDFGISNDDSDLYLQIRFQNQEDLMKIMRGGLNIYFDPEGKKNKKYALSVERDQKNRPVQKALTTQELIDMAMNSQLPVNVNQRSGAFNAKMAETICKDLEKVTWKKEDNESIFYRNATATQEKIIVELESENPSELILTVKMPLSEISVKTGEILAVGIETGTPGGQGGARPAGTPQGGGMSGVRGGGGMGGGRGGMGGGGMQGGGSGAPMGAGQATAQPFRYWFLAQL